MWWDEVGWVGRVVGLEFRCWRVGGGQNHHAGVNSGPTAGSGGTACTAGKRDKDMLINLTSRRSAES